MRVMEQEQPDHTCQRVLSQGSADMMRARTHECTQRRAAAARLQGRRTHSAQRCCFNVTTLLQRFVVTLLKSGVATL